MTKKKDNNKEKLQTTSSSTDIEEFVPVLVDCLGFESIDIVLVGLEELIEYGLPVESFESFESFASFADDDPENESVDFNRWKGWKNAKIEINITISGI